MNTFFNLLTSLMVAIVASYFTVKFSLNQFYSQKWWEKKIEAYSDVIEKMSLMLYYFGAKWDSHTRIGGPSQSFLEKIQEEYFEVYQSLKKSATSVAFIISKEASSELEDLITVLDNLEEDWLNKVVEKTLEELEPEPFIQQHEAVKKSITTIKKIAEQELSKK